MLEDEVAIVTNKPERLEEILKYCLLHAQQSDDCTADMNSLRLILCDQRSQQAGEADESSPLNQSVISRKKFPNICGIM